jgi:hypothetical protein
MAITYSKGSSDQYAAQAASSSSSHLTAIAIAVSVVFLVVATGLWYGFSQSKKAVESVPAAIIPIKTSPAVEQARVYEAIDGLQQCHKNIPDLTNAEGRRKRQNCYYAVMTIFTTSSVCSIITLDGPSAELCKQAELRFIKEYPNGMPRDDAPASGVNGTTSTGTSNTNRGTTTQGSGTGSGGTTSNKNSTSTGAGSNTNTNTSSNTNTTAQNTNTNTSSNTNSSGNTNAAANTNTSNNQNSNSTTNTNQNPPSNQPLCVNDPGEVVLLEHTNDCQ